MNDDVIQFEPIPGETPINTYGLKIAGILSRQQLIPLEAENIRKATAKYLGRKPTKRMAPFNYDWALKLHKEMLGDIWDWAGHIRNDQPNLGVRPDQIYPRLKNLLDDLHTWPEYGHDWILQSVWLHHRTVFIHPFRNGNGRWSRLLTNIWLKQHGQPLIMWPDDKLQVCTRIRREYLNAIGSADAGDEKPLMEFHRRYQISV